MDCKRFSELLDGMLTDDLRHEMNEHAERCDSCRAALEPPADLVGAILKGTTGSTCDIASELLCDYVDEQLQPVDEELTGMHLEGCDDCTALSRAIARLSADLPLLAELHPDQGFVADVMAHTTEAHWSFRVEKFWRNLLARPRIAWEGAYVGAFIFALLFLTPASPLANVNPVAELAEPVERLQERVSSETRSIWSKAGDRTLVAWSYMSTTAVNLKEEIGTIVERLASEQETEQQQTTEGEEQ